MEANGRVLRTCMTRKSLPEGGFPKEGLNRLLHHDALRTHFAIGLSETDLVHTCW